MWLELVYEVTAFALRVSFLVQLREVAVYDVSFPLEDFNPLFYTV